MRIPSRRGFVLPLVLLLSMVAALTVAASLERQNAQTNLVERQLNDYRRHHEMLGVRAVVEQWLGRRSPQQMRDLADAEGPSYSFVIEEDVTTHIFLERAQNVPLADVEAVPEDLRETYQALLDRLPEDRPDLRRRRGPAAIDGASAPPEVLAAMLDDGERFAERVMDQRERRSDLDRDRFMQLLQESGLETGQVGPLGRIITFEPTLWRARVVAEDQRGRREFGLVLEVGGDEGLRVHEWLTDAELARVRSVENEQRE